MAEQRIKVDVTSTDGSKTYSKTFKGIAAETFDDVAGAKGFASDYSSIVEGTFKGGEFSNVTPFEAD